MHRVTSIFGDNGQLLSIVGPGFSLFPSRIVNFAVLYRFGVIAWRLIKMDRNYFVPPVSHYSSHNAIYGVHLIMVLSNCQYSIARFSRPFQFHRGSPMKQAITTSTLEEFFKRRIYDTQYCVSIDLKYDIYGCVKIKLKPVQSIKYVRLN